MNQILTPTIFQSQLIRYLAVSVSGTGAHYMLLVGLYHVGLNPILASTYGALVGALVIYICNYTITFRSTRPHKRTVPKFILVVGVGLLVNGAVLYCTIEYLSCPLVMAQITATLCQFFFGFVFNRHLVF